MSRSGLAVFAFAALAACPTPKGVEPDAGVPQAQDAGCSPLAERLDGGTYCAPILPPAECPPGTMPVLGSRDCQPVGPTCTGGFVLRADGGVGCDVVLPPGPCGDGGLATPGDSTCGPLSDCDAPFPPASATLFVDHGFDGGAVDATHFTTISAALAAAPAGATIAVESGAYDEALAPARAVKLIGRCADRVLVRSTGTVDPGLTVQVSGVEVQGLRFTGHRGGAVVVPPLFGAATLVATACDFAANRDIGVAAFDGAKVTLDHSVVRQTMPMADGGLGRGVEIEAGSSVLLVRSLVEQNAEVGLFATDAQTTFELRDSVVRDTRVSGDGTLGRGVYAKKGARGQVVRSALVGNRDTGGYTSGSGSMLTLVDSVVEATQPAGPDGFGRGLSANFASVVTLTNSTVRANIGAGVDVRQARATLTGTAIVDTDSADGGYGDGLFSGTNARVAATGCAVVGNRGTGVTVGDALSTLVLDRTLVADTRTDNAGEFGFGVLVVGAHARLTDVAVLRSSWAGVVSTEGLVTGERLVVSGVSANAKDEYGEGALSLLGGKFDLTDTVLEHASTVGALCDASSCVLRGGWVRANPIGIAAQGGTSLQVQDVSGDAGVPLTFSVSPSTVFDGNLAKVSAQVLPLPPMPGAPP